MRIYDHVYVDRSSTLFENDKDKKWVMLGVGFDSTETHIPGQRLAPQAIRNMLRHKDHERFYDDIGDLIVVHGNAQSTLQRLEDVYEYLLNKDKKTIMLGGEHTITLGAINVLLKKHSSLQLICFDAHYDAKNDFEGEKINHSTVMRRIHEAGARVLIIGGRRYDEDERLYAQKHFSFEINSLKDIPTYISIDIDYFDPSLAPGCADKEHGGYYFHDFVDILKKILKKISLKNVVGVDIVEVNPLIDPSNATSSLAADVVLHIGEVIKNDKDKGK